ncbi:hypothetical protein RhiirA4_324325, partial [Rhizophagus irregularis]
FISKATFDNIISKYISFLPENQQEKALINKNIFERIKKILLDPSNKEIDTKATRKWAKKRFILEEIGPGDYRIIVISDNKPVLIVEKMYEVLCRTHAEIDNHAGQKQLWESIKQN